MTANTLVGRCASSTNTSAVARWLISLPSMSIMPVSFGRCEATTGIVPFDRLVEQVMTRPPYNEARRVFWIVDNGSSHRGLASVRRLQGRYPRLTLVHGPIHASWLNQIEIHFSIVQRKVLSPNDFTSLGAVAERLLDFQSYWEITAKPFQWKFTRRDLAAVLAKYSSALPTAA